MATFEMRKSPPEYAAGSSLLPVLALALASVAVLHPGRFSPLGYRVVQTEDILAQLRPSPPSSAGAGAGAGARCWPDLDRLAGYRHNQTLFREDVGSGDLVDDRVFSEAMGISAGGAWTPETRGRCLPSYHSVVIVPYRSRADHLARFLRLMHPFLQSQDLSYLIVVVEQEDGAAFNRAKLFNVGFAEAVSSGVADLDTCFIFHDVDQVGVQNCIHGTARQSPQNFRGDFLCSRKSLTLLPLLCGIAQSAQHLLQIGEFISFSRPQIPLDGRNVYACSKSHPRHLSSHMDVFRYNLIYGSFLGGVAAIPGTMFKEVGGFSNRFFGWGGEDDDMSVNRLHRRGYRLVRFCPRLGRYRSLPHPQERRSGENERRLREGMMTVREKEAAEGGGERRKDEDDGLDNLKYRVVRRERRPLFYRIVVDV